MIWLVVCGHFARLVASRFQYRLSIYSVGNVQSVNYIRQQLVAKKLVKGGPRRLEAKRHPDLNVGFWCSSELSRLCLIFLLLRLLFGLLRSPLTSPGSHPFFSLTTQPRTVRLYRPSLPHLPTVKPKLDTSPSTTTMSLCQNRLQEER